MHDHEETRCLRERTDLLNRIGVQLTMIAEGSDARLNNILKHLREALRQGHDTERLNQTANSLFKHLMLEEEQQAPSGAPVGQLLATAVKELINVIQLPAKTKAELQGICKKLEKSEDLTGALSLIKQIVTRLRDVNSDGADADGSSKKRLFGKKNKDAVIPVQQMDRFISGFKELLTELLGHMEVLNEDHARVVELKNELSSSANIDQLEGILYEVLALLSALTTDVRTERKQTEKFLNQLRDRLQDVEGDISGAMAGETDALERAELLGSEVGAEIGGIEEAVREDNDLQHLKEFVGGHLKIINKQLIDHIQEERVLHDETKTKVKQLTRKVREMENEADELRLQVHKKQQLAMKDVLTGVYNRAAYEDRIVEEMSRSKRNSTPLSIVLIDCDKFKFINDNFGHKAGDLVLKKVADVMKSRARSSDFLARYGGDEFIVLLPDTAEDGAKTFAEGVRQKVANAGFNDSGRPLDITISSGLTVVQEGDTAETAFERADKAMYLAKNAGRNDVGVL